MSLIAIPIAGGLDESVQSPVGSPRLQRLERARYQQPGEISVSPGYRQRDSMSPTGSVGAVGIGYSEGLGLCAAIDTGKGVSLVPENAAPTLSGMSMPRYLAPKSYSMTLPGAVTQKNSECCVISAYDDQSVTIALAIAAGNGSTTLSSSLLYVYWEMRRGEDLITNGAIPTSLASTSSIPGLPSAGDAVAVPYAANATKVYKFSASTASPAVVYTSTNGSIDHISQNYGSPSRILLHSTTQNITEILVRSSDTVYSLISQLSETKSVCLPREGTAVIAYAYPDPTYPTYGIMVGYRTLDNTYSEEKEFIVSGPNLPQSSTARYQIMARSLDPSTNTLWVLVLGTLTVGDGTNHELFAATYKIVLSNAAGSRIVLWANFTRLVGTATIAPSTGIGANFPILFGVSTKNTALNRTTIYEATVDSLAAVTYISEGEIPAGYNYSRGIGAGGGTIYVQDTIWVVFASLSQLTGAFAFASDATVTAQIKTHFIEAPAYRAGSGADSLLVDGYQWVPTPYGDIIPCGIPQLISGSTVTVAGLTADPAIPQVVPILNGSVFSQGTYQYITVYTTIDGNGNWSRTAPSLSTSAVVDSTGASSVLVYIAINNSVEWASASVSLEIYRTTNNGTVFYLLTTLPLSQQNLIDGVLSYSDTMSDTSLSRQGSLYTQGTTAATGGLKARYGVPPCRCAWSSKERLIVGGLSTPNRIRFSGLYYPGEAIWFPHSSEVAWTVDLPSAVTAVAALDDVAIAFTRTAIYAIYGTGPDDSGSGTFDPPRKIAAVVGALHSRGVAEIPEGLLFQAADGQIYLLSRGNLAVSWFSEKARSLFTPPNGETESAPCSVVCHPTANTVHFYPQSGAPIVYDRRTNTWSTDGDGVTAGLTGVTLACACADPDDSTVVVSYDTGNAGSKTTTLLSEITSTTQTRVTSSWLGLAETNDMSLFGLSGWGRMDVVNVMIQADGAVTGSLAMSYWWDRGGETASTETTTLPYSIPTGGGFTTSAYRPSVARCSSAKIRVSFGDSITIVGFALEATAAERSERIPSARRA